MHRRSKNEILFSALLIALLLIGITYYRMDSAKKDLADYWIAKSCSSKQNCRQKVKTVILKAQEKSLTINVITKGGNTNSSKKILYYIWLSLDSHTHEIRISPNPPSNGTPFDIPNVHIPSGLDSSFVEENFYERQPSYVEVWHDKITILYLDIITDVPEVMFPSAPLPNSPPVLTSRDLPETYEIALPTVIHPIFRQASTEYDFSSTVIICSFLMTMLIVVLYIEDADRVWKKLFNKKIIRHREG